MEPIVFVGNDRHVYVLDRPESAPRHLTADAPGGAFTWPTWAPDRGAVAVMRQVREAGGERGAVELRDPATGTPRRVWTAQEGGPVFLYWAPDGARLGLLVQEADGLHLLVAERAGGPPIEVAAGAPLYWAWAPDGTALVVHVGGHHRRGTDARVLLVRLEEDRARAEVLSRRPLGFRAPAWEPGTRRVAFAVADDAGRRTLVVLDTASGQMTPVAPVGEQPAFVWAPSGGRLALAQERTDAGLYEGLTVLDLEGGEPRELAITAVAFLWTPTSDALLCATVAATGDALTWERVTADGRERRPLVTCRPTQELALLLAHFDQYAPAVCLHSREEAALLVPDSVPDGRHNGRSSEHADIWLVESATAPALRRLAGGTLAFFAP